VQDRVMDGLRNDRASLRARAMNKPQRRFADVLLSAAWIYSYMILLCVFRILRRAETSFRKNTGTRQAPAKTNQPH